MCSVHSACSATACMSSERSAELAPDFAARLLCGISFRRLMQVSDASSLNSLAALSAFSLRLLSMFSALARAAARGLSDLPCIGLVLRSVFAHRGRTAMRDSVTTRRPTSRWGVDTDGTQYRVRVFMRTAVRGSVARCRIWSDTTGEEHGTDLALMKPTPRARCPSARAPSLAVSCVIPLFSHLSRLCS